MGVTVETDRTRGELGEGNSMQYALIKVDEPDSARVLVDAGEYMMLDAYGKTEALPIVEEADESNSFGNWCTGRRCRRL
jgi:hypothetical protein